MKKIILPLLLFCLLLTACQSNPATTTKPNSQQAPSANTTATPTTVPPTSAPVPKNTVENAKKVTDGMTLEQVKELLGDNCMEVGSGAIIYQWELTNRQFALIYFARAENTEELIVASVKFEYFAYG